MEKQKRYPINSHRARVLGDLLLPEVVKMFDGCFVYSAVEVMRSGKTNIVI